MAECGRAMMLAVERLVAKVWFGNSMSTMGVHFRFVNRRRRATPVMPSIFENVSDISVCLGLCLTPPANAGVRSKQGAVQREKSANGGTSGQRHDAAVERVVAKVSFGNSMSRIIRCRTRGPEVDMVEQPQL